MKQKVTKWMDGRWIAMRSLAMQKSEGMGTVEIILIIVVLIGLVIIFKEQITDLVDSIFTKITKQTNKI